ncbi:hypothetical protein E2C01_080351 [Portunus trituberculatus]|uniref:Uncharacterized protein n=1 Tax=Portunus trituberculatus TaxID=210409 RepID=A0A5B7ILZ2_PORTR|nr:hypothetical protein [Portunus trituberculatus]
MTDVYVSSLAPCEGLRRAGAAQVVDLFLAAQMVQKCVETHQGAAASTLVMLESACPHQVCVCVCVCVCVLPPYLHLSSFSLNLCTLSAATISSLRPFQMSTVLCGKLNFLMFRRH